MSPAARPQAGPKARRPSRKVSQHVLVLIAPGVILLGTILPSIWKTTRDVRVTGESIGRLTGANTLAAVAGSLAAGFVIIPQLGVARGIVGVGALYGLLAVLAIVRTGSPRRWIWAGALVLVLTGLFSQQPARLKPVHLGKADKLLDFYEGESGSVAVVENPFGLWMKMNNFYLLGSTGRGGAARRVQGELGLVLHPDPKRVAFIGVATGISMSPLLEHPEVEEVTAMEIIPGVLTAAREHFAAANRGVLEDPRVSVITADGRNHLFGTSERFDVVVSDLFVPWQAGTGYLYTTEHFETVRSRLKPGGTFLLWVQMDQLSRRELQIIAGTFADVFDDSELWLNQATPGWPLVALIGWQEGGVSREPCSRDRESELSQRRSMARVECMFATGMIRRWAQAAPRNSDDLPILEFQSGLNHFRLSGVELQRTIAELGRMRPRPRR